MCRGNTREKICGARYRHLLVPGTRFNFGPQCRVAIQDHIIVNRLTPTHWRSNLDNLLRDMYLVQHGREILDLMRPKVERCVRARIGEMVEGGIIREVIRDGADVEYEWRHDADNFLGQPGWNRDWSFVAGRVFARQNRARSNNRRQARQGGSGATHDQPAAIRLEANTIINGVVKNSNNVGNGGGMSHIMTLLGNQPRGRIGGRDDGLVCGGARFHAPDGDFDGAGIDIDSEEDDYDGDSDGDNDDDDGETLVPDSNDSCVQEVEPKPDTNDNVHLDYDVDTEMTDAPPAPDANQFQYHHSGRVDLYWHDGHDGQLPVPPPPSLPTTQNTPPLFAFARPNSPTVASTNNPSLFSLNCSPASSICSIVPSDSQSVVAQRARLAGPPNAESMRAEFRTRSIQDLAAALDEIAKNLVGTIIQAAGMNPAEPDYDVRLAQRGQWAMVGRIMREVMAEKMGIADQDELDSWDFWWFAVL
ncbi:hypothetical protein CDV36_014075 [Fusarium kuroshium]|uniref:Uncharacterized protein n=1 Tax=Fusarium kuroshium TaxID=2010991 RepID=A0A3M2RIU8_9HYPO|nr:hypothetical protein CDV36_014075 [Fusarium kuroshium]